jgi:hypothetical protein
MQSERTHSMFFWMFLICTCVPAAATAQVAALNDDIVSRVLPALRVDAAQAQQGMKDVRESAERGEQYLALVENMRTGKADPLSWLKTQSRFVLAPPSAVYQRRFSQAISAFLVIPVAVYSFGLPAPDELVRAMRTNEGARELMTSGRDPLASPAGLKLKALNDRVTAFYLANKFSEPNAGGIFFQCSMVSPDSTMLAVFSMSNTFPGLDGAEEFGDGPLLLLQPNSQSDGAPAASLAPDQLGMALKRAGLSQVLYDEYLSALILAKSDSANPAALELQTSGDTNAETATIIAEMKAFYAIRRKNMDVYRRQAQQVGPLLEAIGK